MDATILPTASQNKFFYWRGLPSLVVGLSQDAADTTLSWSVAPLDENNAIITGGFLTSWTNKAGQTEIIWVPEGAVEPIAGLSATGCVRGINPAGIDFTTGHAAFILNLDGGSPGRCTIAAQDGELFRAVLQGIIASGGTGITIGVNAVGTVTVYRSTGAGTKLGFMRWNTGNGKTEYSNDGVVFNTIDSVAASNLVVVSNSDTTPGTLVNKTASGTQISRAILNPGANEQLQISTTFPTTINDALIYTPAFLTGGNAAESLFSNWLAVLNGSFRISMDGGVNVPVSNINFTGVTSMNDVAAKIQVAIRNVIGTLSTVVWSVDHFIITSGFATSSSTISVLSATGAGTDISGAGASNWMDADVGHGVVTPAVLNQAADAGKIALLAANGKFKPVFLGGPNGSSSNFLRGDGVWASILKFGDGSDGALSINAGVTDIDLGGARVVVKNYTSISITGTGKVTTSNPHASGTILVMLNQGNTTLTSSQAPMIDCSGMGADGATSVGGNGIVTSNGNTGSSGPGTIWKTNGGAGGQYGGPTGGAGGAATSALKTFEDIASVLPYIDIFVGAGGGSGSVNQSSGVTAGSGVGGKGGGALVINTAGAWNFTTAGGISVAGAAGIAATIGGGAGGNGGGGGGGGGYFRAVYGTLTANSGTVTVTGGVGANTATNGGGTTAAGGGGGASGATAGSSGTVSTNGVKSGGNGAAGFSSITAYTA